MTYSWKRGGILSLLSGALIIGSLLYADEPLPLLSAPLNEEVELKDLTWVEVRELLAHGKTTIIIPTAGIEQNGPHVVLGKHGYVVSHTARELAKVLGNALVAPVVQYVPEGSIDPPSGHMRFPGTISIPNSVFEMLLEHTAHSFKAHGFKAILFLGDSGGNQASQAHLAERLDKDWAKEGVRVLHIADYYAHNGQTQWLLDQGKRSAEIGSHAGIRDTSEMLAAAPAGVRMERMAPNGGHYAEETGVRGDPTQASAKIGQVMLCLKVEAALAEIRQRLGKSGLRQSE